MFAKSINALPFGHLSGEGQSRIWETTLDISFLGHGFFVRGWGTKDGPTPSQCKAFSLLINNAEHIRNAAIPRLAKFLDSSVVAPSDMQINSSNVWDFLSPSFIEVHESNEYCAGAGKLGSNAISVGYGTLWIEGPPLLHIGVLDGIVDEIYSE